MDLNVGRDMRLIPKNSYVLALALGAFTSAYVNSFFFFAEWWAVSPHGSDIGLWVVLFFIFPMTAVVLAFLPAVLLLAIFKRTRKLALHAIVFLLVYVGGEVIYMRSAEHLRMHTFYQLAERSALLIDAITRFETDHGKPPSELTELVPDYLTAIPTTGMKAYPKYQYFVPDNAQQFEGNSWALVVDTPKAGLNFDMFIYFPKKNYPKYAYSSWLERIGDWAYCHE